MNAVLPSIYHGTQFNGWLTNETTKCEFYRTASGVEGLWFEEFDVEFWKLLRCNRKCISSFDIFLNFIAMTRYSAYPDRTHSRRHTPHKYYVAHDLGDVDRQQNGITKPFVVTIEKVKSIVKVKSI